MVLSTSDLAGPSSRPGRYSAAPRLLGPDPRTGIAAPIVAYSVRGGPWCHRRLPSSPTSSASTWEIRSRRENFRLFHLRAGCGSRFLPALRAHWGSCLGCGRDLGLFPEEARWPLHPGEGSWRGRGLNVGVTMGWTPEGAYCLGNKVLTRLLCEDYCGYYSAGLGNHMLESRGRGPGSSVRLWWVWLRWGCISHSWRSAVSGWRYGWIYYEALERERERERDRDRGKGGLVGTWASDSRLSNWEREGKSGVSGEREGKKGAERGSSGDLEFLGEAEHMNGVRVTEPRFFEVWWKLWMQMKMMGDRWAGCSDATVPAIIQQGPCGASRVHAAGK